MQTALHTVARVQPGCKIEIFDQNLPSEGSSVEVILIFEPQQKILPSRHRSIIDVLADAPGHLAFENVEQVDLHIREERDSWGD